MLELWYKSGGEYGRPLPEQHLIQLAFTLNKTVDELLQCDTYYINRMLMDMEARACAQARKK